MNLVKLILLAIFLFLSAWLLISFIFRNEIYQMKKDRDFIESLRNERFQKNE